MLNIVDIIINVNKDITPKILMPKVFGLIFWGFPIVSCSILSYNVLNWSKFCFIEKNSVLPVFIEVNSSSKESVFLLKKSFLSFVKSSSILLQYSLSGISFKASIDSVMLFMIASPKKEYKISFWLMS